MMNGFPICIKIPRLSLGLFYKYRRRIYAGAAVIYGERAGFLDAQRRRHRHMSSKSSGSCQWVVASSDVTSRTSFPVSDTDISECRRCGGVVLMRKFGDEQTVVFAENETFRVIIAER